MRLVLAVRRRALGGLDRGFSWLRSLPSSLLLAVGLFLGMAFGAGASAVATTTVNPVKSGFTTLQSDLVTYLGYAAVLVVAIAGIAIGLTMLIRWARRAARA